jgi:cytoskeletal protein RodZ
MKTRKDIQVEDSPSLETKKSAAEPTAQPQAAPKPGFFKRILPWIIVAVVFFIGGACLVYFTLYQNSQTALSTATQSSAKMSEQLAAANVDLEKAKSDLGTSQSALVDANNALSNAQQLSILYKFQADVNTARTSLARIDPSSARQALTIAGADLVELQKTSISTDNIAGLQPQLDLALTNLETDPQKAASAMDTLYTNLLLISGNIK